jgi:putative transcriptional regulator
MTYKIDFKTGSSTQIEAALCERLEVIRLSRDITQKDLAKAAGVSLRTMTRMANGEGISLNTFIRILSALRIQDTLTTVLPDPSVQPIERVANDGRVRQRARSGPSGPVASQQWTWADEDDAHD